LVADPSTAVVLPDPVPVVDLDGRVFTPCTPEKARQNVEQGLAVLEGGVLRLRYRPLAYRRAVRRVLRRDGYRCAWCGGFGSTVDHVIPVCWGGRTVPDNLVVACRACNHSRHNALPSVFLGWTGMRPTHPVILRVLRDEARLVQEALAALDRRPVESCLSKEEAQVWAARHSGTDAALRLEPPGTSATKVRTPRTTVAYIP
jgi:hypothetical protein